MNFRPVAAPWLQNHTFSFFVNGCELGATKSMSNPKIKLRTSIFPAMYFVGKQYNALSPGLNSKITSSQGRVNHHLFVCSNHFRNTCLQVYIRIVINPVESRLSISQTRLLLLPNSRIHLLFYPDEIHSI
jgi:hypothetical protein